MKFTPPNWLAMILARLPTVRRLQSAARASGLHLAGSAVVAAAVASLVFLCWYPYPYFDLAGGRNLFVILVAVDVVCGPLLTAVLFSPDKRRMELLCDIGLVVLIQLAALGYGLYSSWYARPLYLVLEIDRFKVIAAPDLAGESAMSEFAKLGQDMKVRLLSGPMSIMVREPKDEKERQTVLFESIAGGRDYAERPDFYVPYDGKVALARAKPLKAFLDKYPEHKAVVRGFEPATDQLYYFPVVGRQDWVAVVGEQGQIVGFLLGDGF